MLKSLKYSVEFPTGKKLSADLKFESGMTAISGRNEAGKSMVLEMIRYGLFGSAALRGKSSDYKKLQMELGFKVRGTEYVVSRSSTKAELSNADGPVAVGTKPVNSHIIGLFGYDLSVFDTANNCAQGEIERLGSMKPTERKALVDQTVGLTALDDLIKWATDEIGAERRVVELHQSLVNEPEAPVKPQGYMHSASLETEYRDLLRLKTELNQLTGWLASAAQWKEPVAPAPAPSSMSTADLRKHETLRLENERLRRQLEDQISRIPTTTVEESDLTQAIQALDHNLLVQKRQQLEERYPAPELSSMQIEEAERAFEAKRLIDEIARLEGSDRIVCPACDSDFSCEHDTIERTVEELKALGPYDLSFAERYTLRDIHRFMMMLQAREKVQEEINSLPTERVDETYSHEQIRQHQFALSSRRHLESLHEGLASLETLEDKREELITMTAWEQASIAYQRELTAWADICQQRETKTARFNELQDMNVETRLETVVEVLQLSRVYESEKQKYDEALLKFASSMEELVARKARLEDLEKARKALRELKVRVKGYLLPSLNRVASALLSAMTGGERNTVLIDEDFEILIDGQPLSTLSGSGKAVANLAIRLGLGQVLTNKVFSVFMADEIDAAMDVSRAGFTAECLSRLTSNIGQVILVSHKTVNAMHHIVMGHTTNEELEDLGGDPPSD